MITGASTADLAVILVDARKGVLVQTRRHSYLCHLIGIRNVVLAVNKMDLVGYDQGKYDAIVKDYAEFARSIGIETFTAMPISGFAGDNITTRSPHTPWYSGPTLVDHLETVEVNTALDSAKPFRMPVQWVNRPNLDFRGFSGPDRDRLGHTRRYDPRAAIGQDEHGHADRHDAKCRFRRRNRWMAISIAQSRASRSRCASPMKSTVRAAM